MKFRGRKAKHKRATSLFVLAYSPLVIKRNKSNRVDVEPNETKKTPHKPSRGGGGGGVRKRKSSKKRKASYAVRRLKETVPVAGVGYVMELSLTSEKIYQLSKNHIKRDEEPKFQVKPNRAQDLKDEFSSYCGEKKKIKNWLYYV